MCQINLFYFLTLFTITQIVTDWNGSFLSVCLLHPKTELFSDLLQGVKVTLEIETDQAVQNIFRLSGSSHFNMVLLTLWRGLRQNPVALVVSLPVRYYTGTSHHLKVNDSHQHCAPLSGKAWKQPFDRCLSHPLCAHKILRRCLILTCGWMKVKWKKRWDCGSAIKPGRNSILQTVIMRKFACGIVNQTCLIVRSEVRLQCVCSLLCFEVNKNKKKFKQNSINCSKQFLAL